jgi:hypothetical protein
MNAERREIPRYARNDVLLTLRNEMLATKTCLRQAGSARNDDDLSARNGLPLVQEIENVLGSHGAGGFEFAPRLAEEDLTVGIEHGDGGHTVFDGNVVFLGHVEILVHVADVDVDDDEGFVQCRGDLRAMKRFVQNMAIKAPVAAEDDEKALVSSRCGAQTLGDFGARVSRWIVDLLLVERLTKARGGGALDDDNGPMIAFLMPALNESDEFLWRRRTGLEMQRDLQNEEMEIRLRLAFFNEIGGKIGEAFGFQGRPEGELVGQREGLFVHPGDIGFGGFAVKAGKRGGITRKDRSTPLREGGKRGGGRPRVSSAGKYQEKKE